MISMGVKYVCCVRARDLEMKHKFLDGQPMRRISECRVIVGHSGWSFIYPEMYKSALAKRIVISASMF